MREIYLKNDCKCIVVNFIARGEQCSIVMLYISDHPHKKHKILSSRFRLFGSASRVNTQQAVEMGKNSAKRKFCAQSYYRDGPGQEPSEEKKSISFTIYPKIIPHFFQNLLGLWQDRLLLLKRWHQNAKQQWHQPTHTPLGLIEWRSEKRSPLIIMHAFKFYATQRTISTYIYIHIPQPIIISFMMTFQGYMFSQIPSSTSILKIILL